MPSCAAVHIPVRPLQVQVRHNVRTLYTRMHTMLHRRKHKHKRTPEISSPFDLQLEPVSLPGVSQDELALLREKATASRVGIAEHIPRSSTSSPCPTAGAVSSASWMTASRAADTFAVYSHAHVPHAFSRRPVW